MILVLEGGGYVLCRGIIGPCGPIFWILNRKAKLVLYSFPEKKTKLFSKLVLANKDWKRRKYLLTLIPLQALTRTMLCLISDILLPNSPPQWTSNTFYSTFDKFNPITNQQFVGWTRQYKGEKQQNLVVWPNCLYPKMPTFCLEDV